MEDKKNDNRIEFSTFLLHGITAHTCIFTAVFTNKVLLFLNGIQSIPIAVSVQIKPHNFPLVLTLLSSKATAHSPSLSTGISTAASDIDDVTESNTSIEDTANSLSLGVLKHFNRSRVLRLVLRRNKERSFPFKGLSKSVIQFSPFHRLLQY